MADKSNFPLPESHRFGVKKLVTHETEKLRNTPRSLGPAQFAVGIGVTMRDQVKTSFQRIGLFYG
jgi:hypothetical protein